MAEYKVLIPLDGSQIAEHSLAYLAALKRLGDLEVEIMGAVDDSHDGHAEAVVRERNVMSTYLNDIAASVGAHLAIKITPKLCQGAAASEIQAEAARFKPDLLVISTHGRSGLSRWRFGSVADKVIRAVGCDTLVIGPKAVGKEAWLDDMLIPVFKNILVPLDGSALAEEALKKSHRFAQTYGSTTHIVRVVSLAMMGEDAASMIDTLTEAAREYVERTAKGVSSPGGVKTATLIGPPAAQLSEYVKENNVDLVVMTSHGRTGIVRTALGSVTDRLLGAEAPVLIVRAGA